MQTDPKHATSSKMDRQKGEERKGKMTRRDRYSKTGWDGTAFHPDEEFLSRERERIKEMSDADVVEYILFDSLWSEAFRCEKWERCGSSVYKLRWRDSDPARGRYDFRTLFFNRDGDISYERLTRTETERNAEFLDGNAAADAATHGAWSLLTS